MANVWYVTRTFVRVRWSGYVMSVTMAPTRDVVQFVEGLGYQTRTTARNAPCRKKM